MATIVYTVELNRGRLLPTPATPQISAPATGGWGTIAPATHQGFQIVEVAHDPGPGLWMAEFRAGDRLYRYHADRSPRAHALQVCDGGQWHTISTGPQTPLAVESALENSAGLGWSFAMFRVAYEQWWTGYAAGWCDADNASRAGLDF